MGCTKSQESVLSAPKVPSTPSIPSTTLPQKTLLPKPPTSNQQFKSLLTLLSSYQKLHFRTLISTSQTLPSLTPCEHLSNSLSTVSKPLNPGISLLPNTNPPENLEIYSIPIISYTTNETILASKPVTRPLSIKEHTRSIKKSQTLPPSKLSSYIFKPKPSVPVLSPLYSFIELNVKSEKNDEFHQIVNEFNMKQAPNWFIDPLEQLHESELWPIDETLKFFDGVLEKKYAEDQKALNHSETPRKLFSFFLETVENENKLKEILSSLNQHPDNTYIQVIKKLLGLGEKAISLNFSVFLCKVQQDFKTLIREKLKMLKDLQKTLKSPKKPKKNNEKKTIDQAATLFSIFEYTHKHFTNPLTYSTVLKHLCPPTLLYEEYLLFYSTYKSRKIGCQISSLPSKDYFSSILNFIDFPLTPEQQSSLLNYLNSKGKQELKQLLSFATHRLNILKPEFSLKKSEFLLALINSYEFVKDHSVYAIWKMVENEHLDREMFYDEAFKCENGFGDEDVNRLFDEGVAGEKGDRVGKENFVKLMIEAGVAYLKFFQIERFALGVGKKKEVQGDEDN